MPDRSHLSIGEVLSLLREEFPDVTISKIRFLESQGLVDPERTPSGYRKFYEHDVERLRWILRQQRENFLPLKVIRGRLSEGAQQVVTPPAGGDGGSAPEARPVGEGAGTGPAPPGPATSTAPTPPAGDPAAPAGGAPGTSEGGAERRADTGETQGLLLPPSPAASPPQPGAPKQTGRHAPGRPGTVGAAAAAEGNGSGREDQREDAPRLDGASVGRAETSRQAERRGEDAARAAGPGEEPAPPAGGRPEPATPETAASGAAAAAGPPEQSGERGQDGNRGPDQGTAARRPPPVADRRRLDDPGEHSYTLDELAAASGLPPAAVAGLEQFGLISASTAGGVAYYDANALDVAKAAAGFARYGVEARHLRAWRNAADREASLFEQVVTPLLKQRNPQSRGQAVVTLEELSVAAANLHAALLQRALRSLR